MKVFINRVPVDGPWGGGNLFLKAFYDQFKKKGHTVTPHLEDDIDLIFIQDPRYGSTNVSINEIYNFKKRFPNVKIMHRVNECDARKNTNNMNAMLRNCSLISDHTIFVSNWIKDHHLSLGWGCKNHSVVYNGVDLNHFQPRKKIDNNKINIVTHHWSNNPMKGLDYYMFLNEYVRSDDKFTFTYIGNCKKSLDNSMMIRPLHGLELGEELSRYDVYVSGTRYDPGPNHIIESVACGIPTIVYSEGGGAVEFAGEENVFSSESELVDLLNSNISLIKNKYKPYSWQSCMAKVLEVAENL